MLPKMDEESMMMILMKKGLNHNCHLTTGFFSQTSRRTSFCPIKPGLQQILDCQAPVIGQSSVKHRAGITGVLYDYTLNFYYPNESLSPFFASYI